MLETKEGQLELERGLALKSGDGRSLSMLGPKEVVDRLGGTSESTSEFIGPPLPSTSESILILYLEDLTPESTPGPTPGPISPPSTYTFAYSRL